MLYLIMNNCVSSDIKSNKKEGGALKMAGHSKWANRKHRKFRADAQKGKIFTKMAREITVAAREGGADPDANVRLRLAVQKAKEANMPNQNIERAIQKGSGSLEGEAYQDIILEGYGPGGVAMLLEALTDNRNRTVAEVRNVFSKYGGNLGEAGCVSWMFYRKGQIQVSIQDKPLDEEDLMLQAIEAGAEDFNEEEDYYEIITAPEQFESVKESLLNQGISIIRAEITMIPQNTVLVSGLEEATHLFELMETLEDNDDVQNVYSNFDVPDEIFVRVD